MLLAIDITSDGGPASSSFAAVLHDRACSSGELGSCRELLRLIDEGSADYFKTERLRVEEQQILLRRSTVP